MGMAHATTMAWSAFRHYLSLLQHYDLYLMAVILRAATFWTTFGVFDTHFFSGGLTGLLSYFEFYNRLGLKFDSKSPTPFYMDGTVRCWISFASSCTHVLPRSPHALPQFQEISLTAMLQNVIRSVMPTVSVVNILCKAYRTH
jgi:hypothetical protein